VWFLHENENWFVIDQLDSWVEKLCICDDYIDIRCLTKVTQCCIFIGMERETTVYDFSAEKNQLLIKERDISFERVIAAIEEGSILDILPHPNSAKYPNQKIYVIDLCGYVYLVPFVEREDGSVFLKTIFPHRKLTKK